MQPSRWRRLSLLLSAAGAIGVGCRSGGTPPVYDGPVIATPQMNQRFGVVAHLPHGSDPASAAERAFKLARARDLGVAWLREDFLWNEMEASPGVYDFSAWSSLIAQASSSGLSFLPILDYGNPLYAASSGGDPDYPPDDPTHYGNWVSALTGTLGSLSSYEIWNEENAGLRFWKPTLSGDPSAYGSLLCNAYSASKTRRPSNPVVLGGLFGPALVVSGGMAFLESLYQAHPQLSACFDAVGWHPYRYPFTAPDLVSGSQLPLTNELDNVLALLSAHGAGGKRLWITEMGWHTAAQAIFPGVSPQDQARFLVRASMLAVSRGAERLIWYDLVDDGTDETTNQESAFGLIDHVADYSSAGSFVAKPAFSAYRTMIAVLGSALYAGSVRTEANLPSGDYGFAFDTVDGNGRVVAVWTAIPGRTATAHLLRHGYATAQAIDLVGQPLPVALAGSSVSLTYSESPAYLLLH